MSIKTIVCEHEVYICDICGEEFNPNEKQWNKEHDMLGIEEHTYRIKTFDFCEECELLLTEAIINGKMKTHLRGR